MKRLRFARKPITPMDWPTAWPSGFPKRRRKNKGKLDSHSIPALVEGWDLSVMSFNIRRGTAQDGRNHWVFRRHLVHDILKDYRPDVLGLQEALDFQISEISAMLPGYRQAGTGTLRGGKGLHNAIFYNAARFVLSEEGTFWFSDTPNIPGSKGWGNIMPRNCAWVRLIDKKSKWGFYFYNAHLDHLSQRSRKKSVFFLTQHIHERLLPDPFILTGDFNAREKSRPIEFLTGKILLKIKTKGEVSNPEPMFDSFRVCYPDLRNMATYHGFNRYFFHSRIDYIFVPASIRVRAMEIIRLRWKKRFPSDHYPLFAKLVLSSKAASHDSRTTFGKAVNQ